MKTPRRLLLFFTLLLAGVGCARVAAEHPAPASEQAAPSVVFLVRDTQQLGVVLETSKQMLAGEGFRVREARVIVCGGAVSSLRRESELSPALEAAEAKGVEIGACGLSLQREGIEADALSPVVEIIPNGLIEVTRLQSLGFLSVVL